tara:strand:+ start:1748 stop:1882 length:135 start_codon:yes stop_codon:yes gene_type:complete
MTGKITKTANKELKATEPATVQKPKSEEPIVVKRKPNEFGSFYR